MRNRLLLRGDEGAGKGPLVFQRGYDEVSFYLPEGSRAGRYEMAIFHEEPKEPLVNATGTATVEKGMTAMNASWTYHGFIQDITSWGFASQKLTGATLL